MARTKSNGNGRVDRLEEAQTNLVQAQALLVQNQAALVARAAETDRQMAESNRQMIEMERQRAEIERINSERFARIEAILIEHSRILMALPDAIRDKIGFKSPSSSSRETEG